MNETDFLIRGLLKKENIRFAFVDTTSTVTTGIKIHDTDPVASKVFAEAITSAALLAPLLEDSEKYSIRWDYPHGKLKGLLADVNASNDIRALIKQPYLMNRVQSEDDIYGKKDGYVSIIKSQKGKILNSGKTRAGLANPASDAGFFFSVSDQIETELVVSISFNPDPEKPVKRCCGLLFQAMPDCDLKLFSVYRERINTPEFRNMLIQEMPIEKQLWSLLSYAADKKSYSANSNDISYEFSASPGFRCNCSKAKMKQALVTLGKADLKKIFEKNEISPKIMCQFCRKQYTFKSADFKDLLK